MKMPRITVLEGYKTIFDFIERHSNYFKGKKKDIFATLLADILYRPIKKGSLNPMCFREFKLNCATKGNEVTESNLITINKSYKAMIKLLEEYVKPWRNAYDKTIIRSFIFDLKNDTDHKDKYIKLCTWYHCHNSRYHKEEYKIF